jgi:RNA polymerase sigma-70 factor (ECF subfamily)
VTHAERERLFLELFHRNKARIQRLCWGYLDSPQDAEDLFQEIMANVWNSLPSFRGEAQIGTWVYRIAINTALVHRKKWKRGEELTDIADTRPCAQEDLERRERLSLLYRAIASLAAQDRLIVTLLLEGLSYKEMAEITGLTVNHVGVKISRIKQALEQNMLEAANGCD